MTTKDNTTIAELIATTGILNTKLDGAISQLSELKSQFIAFQNNFIRQDLYNVKHEELVKQVTENANEIRHLKENQGRNVSWVWPLITFLLGGVLLFLINYAITH